MEFLAVIVAIVFWWTFWDRLNRITTAVEKIAASSTPMAALPDAVKAPIDQEKLEGMDKSHPTIYKIGKTLGTRSK